MDALLQRNAEQLAASITQLTLELRKLKAQKKAFLSDINPRIKDLEELIEAENDQWAKLTQKE
jgi:uncharacterized FlgJ-related protein